MKKALSLILTLILAIGVSGNSLAYAAMNNEISSYEEILNSINNEFNLELGYIPVNEAEITLEEYEEFTLKIAKQQREVLDHIAMRQAENEINNLIELSDYYVTPRAMKTVPVRGMESLFNITASYDIVGGMKVSNIRSGNLGYTNSALLSNTYVVIISGPTYGYVNGGRDGYVSYQGNVHFDSAFASYKNMTLYSEFTVY